MRTTLRQAILAGAMLVVASAPVQAAVIGFTAITNNSGISGTLESLFTVDVTDLGGGNVGFDFANNAATGVITQVYWDDSGTLTGFANDPVATGFTSGANPPDLPSGNTVGFVPNFSAGADVPPPQNGILPGASLSFDFDMASNFAAILTALQSGGLRIGIHVQSIGANEDSDSFVSAVPLPASLPLILSALAFFGFMRTRRRSRRAAVSCVA